jgi:hypothetical protein
VTVPRRKKTCSLLNTLRCDSRFVGPRAAWSIPSPDPRTEPRPAQTGPENPRPAQKPTTTPEPKAGPDSRNLWGHKETVHRDGLNRRLTFQNLGNRIFLYLAPIEISEKHWGWMLVRWFGSKEMHKFFWCVCWPFRRPQTYIHFLFRTMQQSSNLSIVGICSGKVHPYRYLDTGSTRLNKDHTKYVDFWYFGSGSTKLNKSKQAM